MTAALRQDQWEAGMEVVSMFFNIAPVHEAPPGYVPVPPVVIENRRRYIHSLYELKEDE